jgi:hypothetical protein
MEWPKQEGGTGRKKGLNYAKPLSFKTRIRLI